MKYLIGITIILNILSCEKEKTYQFKLKDGFNIFCKEYREDSEMYHIKKCCIGDERQKDLVKNGIKKEDILYIAIHPQDF